MAPSGTSSSRSPILAAAGAALASLALALTLTGNASGQARGIDRSVIPVSPDAPERYVVQPGDTLWDISKKFLTDPWFWPEIWYINPQVENPHLIYPGDTLALTWVDGQPRVVLQEGGATRLSPRVREQPLSEAILALPYRVISAFMSKPAVLAKEQVKNAPYVARARDHRLIAAEGNELYVRRLDETSLGSRYNVFHVGDELKDPDDGDVLGYQGTYTGAVDLRRNGDPATMMMVESARETLEGDVLLPETVDVQLDFIPRPPEGAVEGTIMSVVDDRSVFGEYDVVVINRGARHGLRPGHVLAIWEAGETVRDTTENRVSRTMDLPDERIGVFMVFKTFDRLSFGLTLEAGRPVQVGDAVRTP